MLVDSHCHLNFPELIDRLDAVFENAFLHDVRHFLTVNTCLTEWDVLHAMTQKYPFVYCSAGVHPHDAKNYTKEDVYNQLLEKLNHPKTIAIGETGLDYYYNNSPSDIQKEIFIAHLDAAVKTQKPVIIHTRDADQDTIDILSAYKGRVKGVFHCFSGDEHLAKKGLDLGFYISFSGIITFNKSKDLQEIVKTVPLDRLLVETDSPFLTPTPHRGKKNEPAYTHFVAQKVAELKNLTLSEVSQSTTKNFFSLFLPDQVSA
ncbi:MAG: putative metal-dependent hydrolase YcfH [Holosporales bacterium]